MCTLPRQPVITEARTAFCPSCKTPFLRLNLVGGHLFTVCQAKLHAGPRRGEKCGQHLHVLVAGNLYLITRLTREEFDKLQQLVIHLSDLTPLAVYDELGVTSERPRLQRSA